MALGRRSSFRVRALPVSTDLASRNRFARGQILDTLKLGKPPAYLGSVYLDYYGLKEQPFNITPNPRFLFYGTKHREALNHVLYGIRERKGFVQLTGEVGEIG